MGVVKRHPRSLPAWSKPAAPQATSDYLDDILRGGWLLSPRRTAALLACNPFVLNTALARGLGPQWYALANVQLYVISATALILSREGLRRASQRIYPGGAGPALTYGVNVAWLSVPTTAAVAALAGVYFSDSSRPPPLGSSQIFPHCGKESIL